VERAAEEGGLFRKEKTLADWTFGNPESRED